MYQNPKLSPEASKLTHELAPRVGAEILPLLPAVSTALVQTPAFIRGYEMFVRLNAAPLEEALRNRVEKDFALFAEAHILALSGKTPTAVAAQLGTERVVPWLTLNQVPEALFDNDPLRGAQFIRRMSVPVKESPDFAYLLGAHAGTRRLGTAAASMSFTSGERALIDRLAGATERSCGIVLGRQQTVRNGLDRLSGGSRAHEFVNYLREVSGGNAHVPWKHIQSSAERCDFIRGFLDFSGGTLDVPYHRLIIGRRNNPGLLEEVAIVLKREGIYARVSLGQIPSLHIESYHGLGVLQDRKLVNAERLLKPLGETLAIPPEIQTGRPEHHSAVMAMAERLSRRGSVSPDEVRRNLALEGEPAGDLSLDTIRQWVRGGHVPASVTRLRDLTALEGKIFSGARLQEIGRYVQARAASLHPTVLTRAIAEFLGGVPGLSSQSGLPKRIVADFVAGGRLPSRAEYRLILSTVGLSLDGEIERSSTAPDTRRIESWLKTEAERRVFGSYRASICLLAREVFQRGEDPHEAVHGRIQRLIKRNSSMLVDDSR